MRFGGEAAELDKDVWIKHSVVHCWRVQDSIWACHLQPAFSSAASFTNRTDWKKCAVIHWRCLVTVFVVCPNTYSCTVVCFIRARAGFCVCGGFSHACLHCIRTINFLSPNQYYLDIPTICEFIQRVNSARHICYAKRRAVFIHAEINTDWDLMW